MTFEAFRALNNLPRYSPPFARTFMGKNGRPVCPDRQRKSYQTAEANREKKAAALYAEYLELCRISGRDMSDAARS
jgi:hypothetical protein